MDTAERIVNFLRNAATGTIIKTPTYSPAYLDPAYIKGKTDAELMTYMDGEIKNLDWPRRIVDAGGSVSIFIIQKDSFNVMHLQGVRVGGAIGWSIVL